MWFVNHKFAEFRHFKIAKLLGLPVLAAFLGFHLLFLGRIYPGVVVAGVRLDGKTVSQAQQLLHEKIILPQSLVLFDGKEEFPIAATEADLSYDFKKTALEAGRVGRGQNPLLALGERTKLLTQGQEIPLNFTLDEVFLEEKIASISSQVSTSAVEPTVSVKKGEVTIDEGKDGRQLDTRALKQKIVKALSRPSGERELRIVLPIRDIPARLSTEELEALRQQAEKLVGKKLVLEFEFDKFEYRDSYLASLLSPSAAFDQLKIAELVANVADDTNREPQNAVFIFEGGRVREFKPAKNGIKVSEQKLQEGILQKLEELANSQEKLATLTIPVSATPPQISTEEVNNLGIKELIGRGTSTFRGSIAGRVHNIGLGASRISGALVAPGETFSFNQFLGDVSLYTGYKQAFIIKDGKTVLGDGGGVCQISSTLFRAILDAGLPIVQRHQHSYRVSYYEQDSKPGYDATVYSPSVDLKFKNDTPGHILVQGIFDAKTSSLVFEIYGSSDGRRATVSNHRVWDVRPAPPTLYQDDPTLPAGTVKQVDFAAGGAKVAFDYTVERGGQTIFEKTFYSNYRPWQAVYLRGTASQ